MGIVVDPSGSILAVDNNLDGPPGTIFVFKLNSDGSLATPVNIATAGNGPELVTFLNLP